MSLRDVAVKTRYRTGVDNLVRDFYIPCLSRSVTYRRGSGFFNSRTFSMAARGLKPFIEHDGKMQLVCSVELDEYDRAVYEDPKKFLDRISQDVLRDLDQTADFLERKRLGVLAYMLHKGHLEIKIGVLPKSHRLYHEKIGIFDDGEGNRVAFEGSTNETPGGWAGNYERFSAFISWPTGNRVEAERVRELADDFEVLWNHQAPGIEVVPLPEAVRRSLLRFKKEYDPNWSDEEEEGVKAPAAVGATVWTPGLAMAFDAPRLWNAYEFAFGEVGITPYEHQDYVAASVLRNWPPRYLLADEVGLGKTIEAGLILHGSLAAGRVNRCLILAPKNALKQWQSELKLKFGIEAWRLEGDKVVPYAPTRESEARLAEDAHPSNPFRSKDILLVSSQLIRLENRRDQMLEIDYDLVILDEAHHARGRKKGGERAPNKLLDALQELRYHTQGLLFLTATPIQLDRRELWDLLSLLELPGQWQDEDNFDSYYGELSKKSEPAGDEGPNWAFLFAMARDALARWGEDAASLEQLRDEFPQIDLNRLMRIVRDHETAAAVALAETERQALRVILYRLSPARQMVFRNSRQLLKEYFRAGRYNVRLADRNVEHHSVPLDGDPNAEGTEANLYHRISEYVKKYYRKYEKARSGAGFVVRFYEKRLTSSFHAIRLSLKRRLQSLNAVIGTGDVAALLPSKTDREGLSDEDEEEVAEGIEAAASPREVDRRRILEVAREEQKFLSDFVRQLDFHNKDSKADFFDGQLESWLRTRHRKAIVFSQFADTVNYLKDRFVQLYGDRVGTYTGDGGLFWREGKWNECTKSELQAKFADENDTLDILFCTDAASESLNLQACSLVVNYDIPWNPMRIEQRIGRVDRIGQKSPTVDIHILTYSGTVEDLVYDRCLERIKYSLTTLGHFQPILAQQMESTLRTASLEDDPQAVVESMVHDLDVTIAQHVEDIQNRHFLNHYERQLVQHKAKVPVTQEELEQALSPALRAAGWREQGQSWESANGRITFRPGSTDIDLRGSRFVTPRDELGQLVDAPGPLPESLTLADGETLRRVGVGTSGRYVAYFLQAQGRWYVLPRLAELGSPSGQAFASVEEAQRYLEHEIRATERSQLESESQLWEYREQAWVARANLYVNRVAEYVARAKSDPELAPLAGKEFSKKWQAYLGSPDRQTLVSLIRESGYKPQTEILGARRGRAPSTSPRKTEIESDLLRELAKIRSRRREAEGMIRQLKTPSF